MRGEKSRFLFWATWGFRWLHFSRRVVNTWKAAQTPADTFGKSWCAKALRWSIILGLPSVWGQVVLFQKWPMRKLWFAHIWQIPFILSWQLWEQAHPVSSAMFYFPFAINDSNIHGRPQSVLKQKSLINTKPSVKKALFWSSIRTPSCLQERLIPSGQRIMLENYEKYLGGMALTSYYNLNFRVTWKFNKLKYLRL